MLKKLYSIIMGVIMSGSLLAMGSAQKLENNITPKLIKSQLKRIAQLTSELKISGGISNRVREELDMTKKYWILQAIKHGIMAAPESDY